MIRNAILSTILGTIVLIAVLQGRRTESRDLDVVSATGLNRGIARAGLGGGLPGAPQDETKTAEPKKGDGKATSSKKIYPEPDPAMGHLEGRVFLEGAPPKLAKFPGVPETHKDAKYCIKKVRDTRVLLGKSDGKTVVQNCVVTVDEKKKFRKRPAAATHSVDNNGCLFKPRISAMSVGSKLEVTSSDPVIHNAQGLLALNFNSAITKDRPYTSKTARKPGLVLMNCSFHTWMQARVHILPHAYFDVSGEDGSFKIMNIPPGTYTFEARHEVLAPFIVKKQLKKKITIEKGKTATWTIELEAPK